MTDQRTPEPVVSPEVRDRAVLPALIPALSILVVLVLVFSLSRVLLTAGQLGAVVIATLVSVVLLFGCAAVASSRRMRSSSVIGLVIVSCLALLVAGAAAIQRGPVYPEHAPEVEGDPTELTVVSDNLDFDTDLIELSTAGARIHYLNQDTQPHNIAIYPDDESFDEPLFRGEIIDGGEEIVYEVPPMDAGEYYFHCDVHPMMDGTVVVSEAEPAE
jgi:plastocyanin